MLFLSEIDHASKSESIDSALRKQLPSTFLGYSTNFSEPDPNDNNVQQLIEGEPGSINHRVEIFTLREYLLSYLGFDIDSEIEPADWLTFPEQKLRTVANGEVFHDDIGMRSTLDRFNYYPRRCLAISSASAWNRIGQEEHLMGRAGLAGDEIGSALIGARLGARHNEVVFFDGARLRSVSEVVRNRISKIKLRGGDLSASGSGFDFADVAGARETSRSRLRTNRRDAQRSPNNETVACDEREIFSGARSK
jgi:hypothetical protein